MTRWLVLLAVAVLVPGCGGHVEDRDSSQTTDPDSSTAIDGTTSDGGSGGPAAVSLPNGCVLCNDDALCNHCLIQMSEETWRCPVMAGQPRSECWGVGEVHAAEGVIFTCYYC